MGGFDRGSRHLNRAKGESAISVYKRRELRWKRSGREPTIVDKEPERHPDPTPFPPAFNTLRGDSNGESWEDRESDKEDARDGDVYDSVSTEDLHGGGRLFGG